MLAQLLKKVGSPRFDPVIFTTMPGAMEPGAMEAALTTEAAVNEGVCASAEKAKREKEIVMPISDVRNGYSISRPNCIECL